LAVLETAGCSLFVGFGGGGLGGRGTLRVGGLGFCGGFRGRGSGCFFGRGSFGAGRVGLAVLSLIVLVALGLAGFALGRGLRLGRGWGTADAQFFLHEDFGEAEAASAEFAGFVVGEEFDAFLAYFGKEDLPGFLTKVVDGEEGAVLGFAALLLGLAAALVFFPALAFLLAAGLLGIAAGLFGFAALLGGELLGLGIAGRARVFARGAGFIPGRTGLGAVGPLPAFAAFLWFPGIAGAGGVSGEGFAREDADFGRAGVSAGGGGFVFCRRGFGFRSGRSGGFFFAGHGGFSDVLHDFGRKVPRGGVGGGVHSFGAVGTVGTLAGRASGTTGTRAVKFLFHVGL